MHELDLLARLEGELLEVAEAPFAPLEIEDDADVRIPLLKKGLHPVEPLPDLLHGQVGGVQPERGRARTEEGLPHLFTAALGPQGGDDLVVHLFHSSFSIYPYHKSPWDWSRKYPSPRMPGI